MKKVVDTRRANLNFLVERDGLTSTAKRFKKPTSQIKDMATGRKSFGEKVTREMEANYDPSIPQGWLDKPMFSDSGEGCTIGLSNNIDEQLLDIPQYDTGGAMGDGLILRDQPGTIQCWRVNQEWLSKNVKGYSSLRNLCIVTGFGDSMRPLFNSGDPVLIDTSVKTVEFDSVYFFRVGEEGFIKRLQRIPGEGLRVLSANRDQYEPWTIKPDMDFEILGRVLKVWRSEDF